MDQMKDTYQTPPPIRHKNDDVVNAMLSRIHTRTNKLPLQEQANLQVMNTRTMSILWMYLVMKPMNRIMVNQAKSCTYQVAAN
jgi:hypothetical protein